jgi:ATP synthase F1 gamma subunit
VKRLLEIKEEEDAMQTIAGLTSAFESLSSMKIILTKRDVKKSNVFFDEVWAIYKNIRVSGMFQYGRQADQQTLDKELYILITASAGLSGDIDQRLIRLMQESYDPEKQDIVVVGQHGAVQLRQLGIHYIKLFNLPKKDAINVEPLIRLVGKYRETRVFYQSYESLMQQAVKSMSLSEIVETKGSKRSAGDDAITEETYIFEPNALVVVAHMETSMMRLALVQMIYDSRLAQHASRFKAMSAAHTRARDTQKSLHSQYNHARRYAVDQRLKEMQSSLKKLKAVRSGGVDV